MIDYYKITNREGGINLPKDAAAILAKRKNRLPKLPIKENFLFFAFWGITLGLILFNMLPALIEILTYIRNNNLVPLALFIFGEFLFFLLFQFYIHCINNRSHTSKI